MEDTSNTMLDLTDEASKCISQAQAASASMMINDNFKSFDVSTASGILWSICDRLEDLERINNEIWEQYKLDVKS